MKDKILLKKPVLNKSTHQSDPELFEGNAQTGKHIAASALIVLVALFGLGCAHGPLRFPLAAGQKSTSAEIEARLCDVPFPLGTSLKDESPLAPGATNAPLVVTYESTSPVGELKHFYAVEMERCGWREMFAVIAADGSATFAYKKPSRWCVIQTIPHHRGQQLVHCLVASAQSS